jgi:hypothetical protein
MPAGVALLLAAAFFGYMLALLQRRVLGMYSNGDVSTTCLTQFLFWVGKRKKIMYLPCQIGRISKYG